MAKIIIQSMSLRARKARAKKGTKVLLEYSGFKGGQLPPEATVATLFKYWKLIDDKVYSRETNWRLRRLLKAGALAIDPPLQRGQRMPEDLSCRHYRVLQRHRLLGNADPAPPSGPLPQIEPPLPPMPPEEESPSPSPEPAPEESPSPPQPTVKQMPREWFEQALGTMPRHKTERKIDYARRLHRAMTAQADQLTQLWDLKTLRRRLDD